MLCKMPCGLRSYTMPVLIGYLDSLYRVLLLSLLSNMELELYEHFHVWGICKKSGPWLLHGFRVYELSYFKIKLTSDIQFWSWAFLHIRVGHHRAGDDMRSPYKVFFRGGNERVFIHLFPEFHVFKKDMCTFLAYGFVFNWLIYTS